MPKRITLQSRLEKRLDDAKGICSATNVAVPLCGWPNDPLLARVEGRSVVCLAKESNNSKIHSSIFATNRHLLFARVGVGSGTWCGAGRIIHSCLRGSARPQWAGAAKAAPCLMRYSITSNNIKAYLCAPLETKI